MQAVVTVMITVILVAVGTALFKAGTKSYVVKNCPFVLINAKNPSTIEFTVRKAMKKYPESKIYIVNKSASPEMYRLLGIIEKRFDNVTVLKNKK